MHSESADFRQGSSLTFFSGIGLSNTPFTSICLSVCWLVNIILKVIPCKQILLKFSEIAHQWYKEQWRKIALKFVQKFLSNVTNNRQADKRRKKTCLLGGSRYLKNTSLMNGMYVAGS